MGQNGLWWPQGITCIILAKPFRLHVKICQMQLTPCVLQNSFGENFVSEKLKLLQIFCNLDSIASEKLTQLNVRHYLEYYYVTSIMRCSSINLVIILTIMMSPHILSSPSFLRQLPNCHLLQPPGGGGIGSTREVPSFCPRLGRFF